MTRTMASRHSTPIVEAERSRESILSARPSVPDHVVYREFVNETVVLNLETGTYHGLNTSGGKMLETLRAAASVREAAASLSAHYSTPVPKIEEDLHAFCLHLLDLGLVELSHD